MMMAVIGLLLAISGIPSLEAGIPKLEDLKPDERISIVVIYTEPKVTEYRYLFTSREVVISEDGRSLGKLLISADDAVRIDQYVRAVERGRKAGPNLLGAPEYTITHHRSGKAQGTWMFRIEAPKESTKPVLSLGELRSRLR